MLIVVVLMLIFVVLLLILPPCAQAALEQHKTASTGLTHQLCCAPVSRGELPVPTAWLKIHLIVHQSITAVKDVLLPRICPIAVKDFLSLQKMFDCRDRCSTAAKDILLPRNMFCCRERCSIAA